MQMKRNVAYKEGDGGGVRVGRRRIQNECIQIFFFKIITTIENNYYDNGVLCYSYHYGCKYLNYGNTRAHRAAGRADEQERKASFFLKNHSRMNSQFVLEVIFSSSDVITFFLFL